jgi:hypothetical protein
MPRRRCDTKPLAVNRSARIRRFPPSDYSTFSTPACRRAAAWINALAEGAMNAKRFFDVSAGLFLAGFLPATVGAQCPGYLTQWGSFGAGDGQFSSASGVATDVSGNVYVTDLGRVQRFTNTGALLTQWGSYGSGDGQFNIPTAVTADADGNVYVADRFNLNIQKFTSTGAYLCQLGSGGGNGDGQFSLPSGLARNAAGNVFVADTGNSRIQKFGLATPTTSATWGRLKSLYR